MVVHLFFALSQCLSDGDFSFPRFVGLLILSLWKRQTYFHTLYSFIKYIDLWISRYDIFPIANFYGALKWGRMRNSPQTLKIRRDVQKIPLKHTTTVTATLKTQFRVDLIKRRFWSFIFLVYWEKREIRRPRLVRWQKALWFLAALLS
jgi:hypothetical protein